MADRTTFKMNPVTLCALIGGIVSFIVTGAIVAVLWVAAGAIVGGVIGMVVQRYALQAGSFSDAIDLRESATRTELYEKAKDLGIEGRSSMTKDELVQAVTEADGR
jgi:uncharacterized protein YcfJ